ncbi:uncharacterized protein [Miscanthus floridulus]|uniref:uncharacterized protein n=1 Tax=Miscanthus floridulus TaxID=154761 RepID=UPI003458B1D9
MPPFAEAGLVSGPPRKKEAKAQTAQPRPDRRDRYKMRIRVSCPNRPERPQTLTLSLSAARLPPSSHGVAPSLPRSTLPLSCISAVLPSLPCALSPPSTLSPSLPCQRSRSSSRQLCGPPLPAARYTSPPGGDPPSLSLKRTSDDVARSSSVSSSGGADLGEELLPFPQASLVARIRAGQRRSRAWRCRSRVGRSRPVVAREVAHTRGGSTMAATDLRGGDTGADAAAAGAR